MLVGNQGYVPEPYFLTETLRSQSRFHDPFQDSLFSNSATVEGFREWNTSGRSSPLGGPTLPHISRRGHRVVSEEVGTDPPQRTLTVRSSRPIGYTDTLGPIATKRTNTNEPVCTLVAENVYEAQLPSLVTPKSAVPGGGGTKAIRYVVFEVNEVNVQWLCLNFSVVEPLVG